MTSRRSRVFGMLAAAAAIAAAGGSAKAADIKVAYIPCGQVNDASWSEAGYIGMKNAKEALAKENINITIDYSENLPPTQAETAARDYASKGLSNGRLALRDVRGRSLQRGQGQS
jgi:basic membrane lipoprotein Med (substrate-binding protein (PBP1-ABC) superfamily)